MLEDRAANPKFQKEVTSRSKRRVFERKEVTFKIKRRVKRGVKKKYGFLVVFESVLLASA